MKAAPLARRGLAVALTALLAACATPPMTRPGTPPKPTELSSLTLPAPPATPPAQPDFWVDLRESFAMPDCDADPAILAWAQRYTRDTDAFEARLTEALPQLAYAQQIAAAQGVAGEFALLPWVESGFRANAAPMRRGRPAGAWQIMPSSARRMGLAVDASRDGRLDMAAATEAVMGLLKRYHERFGDWRLADYAYNAGESSISRLLPRGATPPAEPALPELAVRAGTREHLAKLLAVACVIREPVRFGVRLPALSPQQRLVAIRLDASPTLGAVAARTGLSEAALHALNPAYRPAHGPGQQLLLPAFAAARLSSSSEPSPTSQDTATAAATAVASGPATHTVAPGETLWHIARQHALDIADLARLNHLDDAGLRPGQVLRLAQ